MFSNSRIIETVIEGVKLPPKSGEIEGEIAAIDDLGRRGKFAKLYVSSLYQEWGSTMWKPTHYFFILQKNLGIQLENFKF